MSGDTIGMMEGAFFVSRTEILEWINDLLTLNLTKVEQVACGSVYCQIIDSIYLNVPMSKVNWKAKHEYEFVNNFKVLQQSFEKNNITRHIEVGKLVKAKYQDNLEFLQWMKRYWDMNYSGEPYDAVSRRKGQDLFLIAGGGKQPPAPAKGGGVAKAKPMAPKAVPKAAAPSMKGPAQSALQNEVTELKLTVETLEKERDFYFTKLRDIEVLLQYQNAEEIPVIGQIQKILYATEDERVEIDDAGNLKIYGGQQEGEGEEGAEEMLMEGEELKEDA